MTNIFTGYLNSAYFMRVEFVTDCNGTPFDLTGYNLYALFYDQLSNEVATVTAAGDATGIVDVFNTVKMPATSLRFTLALGDGANVINLIDYKVTREGEQKIKILVNEFDLNATAQQAAPFYKGIVNNLKY